MKKILVAFVCLPLLSGLLFVATAAPPSIQIKQPNIQAKAPSKAVLDHLAASLLVKNYADKLEKRLKGKCVGYAFVVTCGTGATAGRAGGDARRAPDENPRKMTVDDKLNIASASKTITAAAVLKLLHQKQVSLDSPMYGYLPPDWKLGANIKTITFRELLTHRSGIRFPKEVTYDFLKEGVAGGVKLEDKNVQQYNNSNFALFRVIIPRLFVNNFTVPNGVTPAAYYGSVYMSYVQRHVFLPVGLVNIYCKPTDANPALAYQFPTPVMAGDSFGDMSETNGSRGWNMSARQLSIFMSNLLFTNKILPQDVREEMKKAGLGLYPAKLTGDVWEYGHGGYYPGKDAQGNPFNNGELNSLIIGFSNNVSVALLVNSQLGPGLSPATEAKAAMKEVLQ